MCFKEYLERLHPNCHNLEGKNKQIKKQCEDWEEIRGKNLSLMEYWATESTNVGDCPNTKQCKYKFPYCLEIHLGVSESFNQKHPSTF